MPARKIKLIPTAKRNSTKAELAAFHAFNALYEQAVLDNAEHDALVALLSAKPSPSSDHVEPATTTSTASATSVPAETVPDTSARDTARAKIASDRLIAKSAAAKAVSEFYAGDSKPFKAAGDKFSPLNFANAKSATRRQAALMLAMLTYSGDNIQSDGLFTRGNFRVPARLVFDSATIAKLGINPDTLLAAQPESGCLGNMLNRTVAYISGPLAGTAQREQILRINFDAARREIQAEFGDSGARVLDGIVNGAELKTLRDAGILA